MPAFSRKSSSVLTMSLVVEPPSTAMRFWMRGVPSASSVLRMDRRFWMI